MLLYIFLVWFRMFNYFSNCLNYFQSFYKFKYYLANCYLSVDALELFLGLFGFTYTAYKFCFESQSSKPSAAEWVRNRDLLNYFNFSGRR